MRTRKTAETRKDEIIEATLRLAAQHGPERLTTEAVADAVGLTQPGIFRHFPRKQALWEAVAMHISEMMEARWARAQRDDTAPIDQVRSLVLAQLRLIQSTPAIPALLFSRELHSRNKALRNAFLGLLTRFHFVIADAVARATEARELRKDINPDDFAYLVIGLVQGLAVRWSISGRGFNLAEEGGRLFDLLLSGFVEE